MLSATASPPPPPWNFKSTFKNKKFSHISSTFQIFPPNNSSRYISPTTSACQDQSRMLWRTGPLEQRGQGGDRGWPAATAIFRGACTPIMANVRNSWTSHNRLLGAGAASHTPMPLSLRSRLDQLRWTRAILELNLLFMDCVSISSIPLFLLSWFYALICNSTNCHNLPKNSSMEERIQRTWIFENYFSIVTHSIVFFCYVSYWMFFLQKSVYSFK